MTVRERATLFFKSEGLLSDAVIAIADASLTRPPQVSMAKGEGNIEPPFD